MELFLVGSEIFFRSIKIPVSLQWKARQSGQQHGWPQALLLLLSLALAGPQSARRLNLGLTQSPRTGAPQHCHTGLRHEEGERKKGRKERREFYSNRVSVSFIHILFCFLGYVLWGKWAMKDVRKKSQLMK